MGGLTNGHWPARDFIAFGCWVSLALLCVCVCVCVLKLTDPPCLLSLEVCCQVTDTFARRPAVMIEIGDAMGRISPSTELLVLPNMHGGRTHTRESPRGQSDRGSEVNQSISPHKFWAAGAFQILNFADSLSSSASSVVGYGWWLLHALVPNRPTQPIPTDRCIPNHTHSTGAARPISVGSSIRSYLNRAPPSI